MAKILLLDTVGDSRAAIEKALREAGWEVKVLRDSTGLGSVDTDAVVLAADAAGLAAIDRAREDLRRCHTPVVLVADLDRSGWDRMFSSAEGLGVEALFDKPVDGETLVRRLKGIFAARARARKTAADPQMTSLFDHAIANEEAAEAFYRVAAERVTNPETRDAIEMLMRDEHEHKRLLEEFRSGARPMPADVPESGSVVEAFGTPDFTPHMTPADAFLLAANKERLAVVMYENWARLYPEGPERDLLRRLADVERGHKARVEAMFSNAEFPEEW
jgi:rubrerythrin